MLSKTILAFAGLMASVQAIMVTSPTKDEQLDFSKTIQIKWTSVSTDPSTFNLVLVDQSNMTPIPVGNNVKTSDGSFSLTNFVATPGAQYKFNLVSTDPQNTGILAQSQTFEITKSGGTASSSDSGSSTSTTSTDTSSPTGTGAAATTTDNSASSTLSTSTTAGAPSKTGSATTSASGSASSTGAAPVKSGNAAVALNGKTFGIAGSVFAGLLMLF